MLKIIKTPITTSFSSERVLEGNNRELQEPSSVSAIEVSEDFLCTEETKKDKKTKQISPSKKWFFTFNNYTLDDITLLRSKKKFQTSKYVFQQEIGEKEGTKHLQGCIWFTEKIRPKNFFPKKMWWKKIIDWDAAVNYCSKSQTRDPDGDIYWNNLLPYKPINTISPIDFYPWQKELREITLKEPDNRLIYWYWEPNGGVGKTQFCKYLCQHHQALYVLGDAKNMKYAVIKYAEERESSPRIVLMDIPRAKKKISWIGIEEIKNMFFFSEKYESGMYIGNPPHLIIFANMPPPENWEEELMSKDRLIIKRICNFSKQAFEKLPMA